MSEAYKAADSIIVALITECQVEVSSDPYASGGDDCSFISLEVLKDSAPVRDHGGVASSSGCGLSVHVGSQYLLFLDSVNQPMAPSASLGGAYYMSRQTVQYLRILRDFRNGHVSDLAEPWMYEESRGYCSIKQSIKGQQISFSRRMPDAPSEPEPVWTHETINGETVHRATVPLVDDENRIPVGAADIVAFGEVPDRNVDALFLSVSLQDTSPAAVRRARISVGDRTWSLNRMEANLLLRAGAGVHNSIEYWTAGETAEQILEALVQPSEIVVSATIVSSQEAFGRPDVFPPEETASQLSGSTSDYVGPIPLSESADSSAMPNVRAAHSYRIEEEAPEPVLRLVSRSTQLSGVIKSFHACYAE
ncbi:MAG: hypothetical protein WDZ50_07815 [Woeseia sp.]